jgi:DNA-binding GntR family transcriptional regulator
LQDVKTDTKDQDVPAVSSRKAAHRLFMEALLARRIRPGHLVSQREISEITGATLPAVREALKWLEAENVVRLIPKRGVAIREVTRKEVQNAYQLRTMIEMEAIGPYTRTFDAEELADLRRQTEELIASDSPDGEAAREHFTRRAMLDSMLHQRIVAALDNALVSDVHRRIDTVMKLARLSLPPQFHANGPAFHEHLTLIDRIEARDEDGARSALRSHLEGACTRAVDSVNE